MKIKEREKEDGPSPSQQTEKVFYDNRIKRKNVLALNEKVAAIREYEKMPVYKRIGRMFHCSPDQIKRIVQQKDNILKAWEQRTRRCQDAKTLELKVVRVSMLGKAVYDWIRRMMYYKDFMITDGLIQKMALQFKSAMGLQNFFPHQEWCDKFRYTYKITENDSKLLNIGYMQGYSVQIKDVMKDVLSECTPDGEAAGDNNLDNDDNDGVGNADDADVTDGNGGIGEMSDNESDTDYCDDNKTDTKDHIVLAKAIGQQNQQHQQRTTSSTKSYNNYQSQPQPQPQQHHHHHQHQHQHQQQSISMPQLQSIRQLVALPIKTNSGMTQKVLVATPITPSTVQRSGGVNNGPGCGVNGAPMTMTIIPFTTLAQAQAQQTQNLTIGSASSGGTRNTTNTATGTTTTSLTAERPIVPPPILEIKQEIKKEPEDDIEIKQECISEDEAQEFPDTTVTAATTALTAVGAATAAAAELPEGAAVKVNLSQSLNRLAGLDDASIIDDDNMALASLRQLIRQPGCGSGSASASSTSNNSTTRTARTKQMTLRKTSNIDQTNVKSSMQKQQQQSSQKASISSEQSMTMETITTTAPSAATATLAVRTVSSMQSPATSSIRAAAVAVKKRKRRASTTPTLPPIQSCSEARRYLKLLEDFALYKENFRLIGLITRADEVLRELDGDNDIDID